MFILSPIRLFCVLVAYVDPVSRVTGLARVDERGRDCVVPITLIVGMRHALISPQSYDIRVNAYTYSKLVNK